MGAFIHAFGPGSAFDATLDLFHDPNAGTKLARSDSGVYKKLKLSRQKDGTIMTSVICICIRALGASFLPRRLLSVGTSQLSIPISPAERTQCVLPLFVEPHRSDSVSRSSVMVMLTCFEFGTYT